MKNKSSSFFRMLRWLAGFPFVILVIVFAVSNRQTVLFNWSPVNDPLVWPLCFFILIALTIGFFSGAFVAWINAGTLRRERREQKRRIKELEEKLKTMPVTAVGPTSLPDRSFYALPILPHDTDQAV